MYGDNSTPIFPTEDALTMIRLALAEDVRTGDVTSEWTIPADQKQHARLIAKEDGVLGAHQMVQNHIVRWFNEIVRRYHLGTKEDKDFKCD